MITLDGVKFLILADCLCVNACMRFVLCIHFLTEEYLEIENYGDENVRWSLSSFAPPYVKVSRYLLKSVFKINNMKFSKVLV